MLPEDVHRIPLPTPFQIGDVNTYLLHGSPLPIRKASMTDFQAEKSIVRNLFERTADVRWWATDAAIVDCLSDPTPNKLRSASERLSVILGAYTVYLDLWICDRNGRVVANGRPDRYPQAKRTSVAHSAWFSTAMRLATGDEFTF